MKSTILWAVCFVSSASAAYAQSAGPSAAPDQPSQTFLAGMRAAFHPKVSELAGIKDGQEIDQTQFGDAIPTFRVGLSALRAYDGTSPADSLWSSTPLATRLIRVNGSVRSCLILANTDGAWRTYMIGGAERAVAIDRVTQVLTGTYGADPNSLFLVDIPALNLEFLAYRDGATTALEMASLRDVPKNSLVAGQPMEAKSLLGFLASTAQSMAGLLPR